MKRKKKPNNSLLSFSEQKTRRKNKRQKTLVEKPGYKAANKTPFSQGFDQTPFISRSFQEPPQKKEKEKDPTSISHVL